MQGDNIIWFTLLKLSFWLLYGKWIIEERERKQRALLGGYCCSPGLKYGSRDDQIYILETELIGLVQGLDVRGVAKRRIKNDSQITWFKQLGREWSQLLPTSESGERTESRIKESSTKRHIHLKSLADSKTVLPHGKNLVAETNQGVR